MIFGQFPEFGTLHSIQNLNNPRLLAMTLLMKVKPKIPPSEKVMVISKTSKELGKVIKVLQNHNNPENYGSSTEIFT